MAYRDALETRRAHLRRLEAQLAELKEQEARVRAMPGSDGPLLDRTLGGPKVIEREIRLERALDEALLRRLANETFEVDGRIAREGDVLIWRGEPEPRPRRVEVRVTPGEGGCVVRVRDQGSWRLYAGLIGFTGVLPQLFRSDAVFGTVASLAVVLAVLLVFASLRGRTKKNVRRRMVQTDRFLAEAEIDDGDATEREAPRVRVAATEAHDEERGLDEVAAPAKTAGAR